MKKKNKYVRLKFSKWWMVFLPKYRKHLKETEESLNDAIHRDIEKIKAHTLNQMTLGACNGDCGCLNFHPNLKTEAPHNKNQDSSKSSADHPRQP